MDTSVFYKAGIDIGSTTVKLTVTDSSGKLLFGEYRRHLAHTKDTLVGLLEEAKERLGNVTLKVHITGSGAIGIAASLKLSFVQEVVAVASAVKASYPETDVAVELGGEDAKIIYFSKGGIEERMNGVCAGGTGAFIDQMASLLQTDAKGLNELAREADEVYPIASRCGVFAKTDIQPLINDGAKRANIAASVLQAVVNQTISGLACGNPIRGNVAFLGGPLHFLDELRKRFTETLKLSQKEAIVPENSHLLAAIGASLSEEPADPVEINELIRRLKEDTKTEYETKRLEPLFASDDEYRDFLARHRKASVKKADLASYSGNCFLGIDAGSTTTKLALTGENGELLWSFYDNNHGNPIKTTSAALKKLKSLLPEGAKIARTCSTGYGEQLLKSAFSLDEGEVETVAHATAARFFDPKTDCVLDIGGQDMKCIRLKDGIVDSIMLNEACSSGCGSFLENFANSLGLSAEEFANKALTAKAPVDLGTRCTVFMNSNVKQAQKEGAGVSDISAGLAYSVIKNAIYKVIRLADARELGSHIVVQGGTFYNKAVLRAVEKIAGTNVTCPDISGIMGAFGAALIAKERYTGEPSSMLPFEEIENLTYEVSTTRCGGCENNCLLTVNRFGGSKTYVTGNRCEKKFGNKGTLKGENLFEYKFKRVFDYEPLPESDAKRGVIGIPRVLNMYENYPLWATFFKELGFSVMLSPASSRKIYQLGMESIPSESECYPAKLAHGHIQWLIDHGAKTIFHPSIYYEFKETEYAQNRYNCPMVVSYPENLKNNMDSLKKVHFVHPFLSLISEEFVEKRMVKICRDEWGIGAAEVKRAVKKAWEEQRRCKNDIVAEGRRVLAKMRLNGEKGIVLAGRPYHVDPEINHGIPQMIASYGLNVLTEDSLPVPVTGERSLRVLDQWTYHSRLYNAAEFVVKHPELELVQLNSFGCGLDAVTADQVREILEGAGRICTLLKIDEVNNLGAARIRIRSLLAAMRECAANAEEKEYTYTRAQFTEQMYKEGYTILIPQMSPVHFNLLGPVFRKNGYNAVLLNDSSRNSVEIGLKYVNNDACYPSILMVGQLMEAVLSGKYDTGKLALLMTQTGGCCRASNYVGFIRRALDQAGLSHIPVISLNTGGLESNPGFKPTLSMFKEGLESLCVGDLFMRCLYRVRPYELEKGSANALHEKWEKIASDHFAGDKTYTYRQLCEEIVKAFDSLPINENLVKPRVGIVGEILVKFMPLANNYLVDLLEKEGAEAVVPDFVDFLGKYVYDRRYKYLELGAPFSKLIISKLGVAGLNALRKPVEDALKKSRRFEPPMSITDIAKGASRFLSLSNQYGEGWFLCGEMVELLNEGVSDIICIQPFGCLPNHVMGKGTIKALKEAYTDANIAAVDYDPGASEVNQLNRIKLMLSSAKEKQKKNAG
ncbi:MAG: 2-hydroxyacyl-CoA dehydratase [Lachnospiraceae bacterium]|nr:2-hydroxyacyl-CoA dehydratase [Lachnospiraceae bacterium]